MEAKRIETYFTPDKINADLNNRVLKVTQNFIKKIDAADYPCVGAKSAMHTDQYRFGIYDQMGTKETTKALANDLKTYIKETVDSNSQYMSMIAVFTDKVESELDFEKRLWQQLQKLHDSEEDKPWDHAVGSNPEKKDFSFSFNGTAFFIVGLHPHASRKSRRFGYTALAFNLHRQFEQLRDHDIYEKMKNTIRDREINYDGSINPMLSDHGEGLEAPQYSGRKVDKNWKCPFHT